MAILKGDQFFGKIKGKIIKCWYFKSNKVNGFVGFLTQSVTD